MSRRQQWGRNRANKANRGGRGRRLQMEGLEGRLVMAPVPIVNFSFESNVLGPGGSVAAISNWPVYANDAGDAGTFRPTAGQYTVGPTATNGVNVAYSNGDYFEQVLTTNLAANTTYTLQVDVGDRNDTATTGFSAELWAGGNFLAMVNEDDFPLTNNGFITATLTYHSGATVPAGQPLRIRLGSPGVQTNFDNVRLDATASVPNANPAFTIAALSGGLGTASTFSQGGFSPAQAVDGAIPITSTGWANSGNPNVPDNSTAVWETVADQNTTGQARLVQFFVASGGYDNHVLGKLRVSITNDNRGNFADGVIVGGDVTANWTVLQPTSVRSTNGNRTFIVAGTGEVLGTGGPTAESEVWVIQAVTTMQNITGFRLEALADAALPVTGPGFAAGNGNFVVTEVGVSLAPTTINESYVGTPVSEDGPSLVVTSTSPVVAGPTTAYNVPAATVGTQNFGTGLGLDFNVNSPITLTEFGAFDSGSNGIAGTLTVQLYDRATMTQVGETLTFTNASPGTLVGGSRFKPLVSPISLPAGFQGSIVAYGFDSTDLNGNNGAPPWTTDTFGGRISFVGGGRYSFGGVGTYPTNVDGGPANRYAAGTFTAVAGANLIANDGAVTAVPEVVASANGATVTILANGDFTYDPTTGGQQLDDLEQLDDTFNYQIDHGGGVITTGTATVRVNGANDAPTANAGGPYVMNEGDSLPLAGSGTDVDVEPLTFSWDLNGDGTFGDAVGQSPNVSAATLHALGLSDNLDGTLNPLVINNVRVRVSDGTTSTDSAPTSLTINSVAPEAFISGLPTIAALNQPVMATFDAFDVSQADLDAGFTFIINWGEGAPVVLPAGTFGPQDLSFQYNTLGPKLVTLTVIDNDGHVSAVVSEPISIAQIVQNGDDIIIGGANNINDRIQISLGNGGTLRVKLNNVTYSAFDAINEFTTITVYSGGGSDHISTLKLPIPITVYGGPGNDTIQGTSHNDSLFGEDGNDKIQGALGDDLLDGGAGNDSMDGGAGFDTMTGGNGNDTMYGQAGDDILNGDLPPDFDGEQAGMAGNDKMDGGTGNDLLRGGGGNDSMTGNSGHDILVGEDGNDRLLGAHGRDVLIGGEGADNLDGGAEEDALMGNASFIDSDDFALLSLLEQWADLLGFGDDYETRVANLQFGDLTAADDGARDLLTGQTGRDWYLASLSDNDQIRGRVAIGPDFEILDTP